MSDKDFYDRIDKARSLFTSREAVTRYCHDIRMPEDTLKGSDKELGDSCIQNFILGRYIVGNLVFTATCKRNH